MVSTYTFTSLSLILLHMHPSTQNSVQHFLKENAVMTKTYHSGKDTMRENFFGTRLLHIRRGCRRFFPPGNRYFILFLLLIFTLMSPWLRAQPVAAGGPYSLFICSDSTVKYCGSALFGNNVSVPVTIPGLPAIVGVSGGIGHALFLAADSTVWSLGANTYGELGVGDTLQHALPAQIPGLNGIVQVATGGAFSLFLKRNGVVYACGQNFTGQLGLGNPDMLPHPTPMPIMGLPPIKKIDAGGNWNYYQTSIFITQSGDVWACGTNSGTFGNGTSASSPIPVFTGLQQVKDVSVGSFYALYLKNDGTVLKTNSTNYQPELVQGITAVEKISAGTGYSHFIKTDGTAWAMGDNTRGQLGLGDTLPRNMPTLIQGLQNVTYITAEVDDGYEWFTIFVLANGSILNCGGNAYYDNLGDSTVSRLLSPTPVAASCQSILNEIASTDTQVLNVYPNPTSNVVYLPRTAGSFALYDYLQRPVNIGDRCSGGVLQLEGLAAGIYFLQLNNASQPSNQIIKIIKK